MEIPKRFLKLHMLMRRAWCEMVVAHNLKN